MMSGQSGRSGDYCSHKCSSIGQEQKVKVVCPVCNKEFKRAPSWLKKVEAPCCSRRCAQIRVESKKWGNKRQRQLTLLTVHAQRKPKPPRLCAVCKTPTHNSKFCSGTCRNALNNQKLNGNTSISEKRLAQLLSDRFPLLEVVRNDRHMLSGLELDFYFPSLRIAIEWNGPYHYRPIRGDAVLAKIQTKDSNKKALCEKLGIELIVVKDLACTLKSFTALALPLVTRLSDCTSEMARPAGNAPASRWI